MTFYKSKTFTPHPTVILLTLSKQKPITDFLNSCPNPIFWLCRNDVSLTFLKSLEKLKRSLSLQNLLQNLHQIGPKSFFSSDLLLQCFEGSCFIYKSQKSCIKHLLAFYQDLAGMISHRSKSKTKANQYLLALCLKVRKRFYHG